MPPNSREAGYLWDMLQAARRLQEFTVGLSYEDYLNSILLQSTVERQLEILGEAARRTHYINIFAKSGYTLGDSSM